MRALLGEERTCMGGTILGPELPREGGGDKQGAFCSPKAQLAYAIAPLPHLVQQWDPASTAAGRTKRRGEPTKVSGGTGTSLGHFLFPFSFHPLLLLPHLPHAHQRQRLALSGTSRYSHLANGLQLGDSWVQGTLR